MRTFSYLIVLLGLVLVTQNTFAEPNQKGRFWHDLDFTREFGDSSDFEAIGVAQGEVTFQDQKTVHIGDFYSAGGEASHYVDQLNIDRFWVTSKTIGTVKSYNTDAIKHGSVFIAKYILQVGARDIDVAGTRSFGFNNEKLPSVILTKDSVSSDMKTDTKGDGKFPSKWGLLGDFGVKNDGTITSADVRGGTFWNAGEVKELKYSGGTYRDKGGRIGTLLLAAPSEKQSWGKVDTLMFDSEGKGLITLTGFVGSGGELDFSGIDVLDKVDFAKGGVRLDVTKVVNDLLATSSASSYRLSEENDWATRLRNAFGNEAFTAANIFGDVIFENETEMNITVIRQTGLTAEPDVEVIVRNGEWQDDWQTEGMQTPEPATLAVLGLGLAGLGLASRRRKC